MISSAIRRVHKKLGRRGTALMILGLAKICFGLGYTTEPIPSPTGLGILARNGGLQLWSLVWIFSGAITFACAWLRVGRDWLGFFTACIPPLVWGYVYLWSAVTGEYLRGYAIFVWYAVGHVCLILWAATVPEYSLPKRTAKRE